MIITLKSTGATNNNQHTTPALVPTHAHTYSHQPCFWKDKVGVIPLIKALFVSLVGKLPIKRNAVTNKLIKGVAIKPCKHTFKKQKKQRHGKMKRTKSTVARSQC